MPDAWGADQGAAAAISRDTLTALHAAGFTIVRRDELVALKNETAALRSQARVKPEPTDAARWRAALLVILNVSDAEIRDVPRVALLRVRTVAARALGHGTLDE